MTDQPCPLTPRQLEVLKWIAEGKTCEEIGIIFSRSTFSINGHMNSAKLRAGVVSAPALVAKDIRQGWMA